MGTFRRTERAFTAVGVCALILLCSAMAPRAAAQTPIACGEQVQGSISVVGELDFFAFGATAGNLVTIRVAGSSINSDMVLELYDPSGNLLELVGSRGSTQIDETLSVTGTYIIVVSMSGADRGGILRSWRPQHGRW